jgi:hypothetical protein
LPGIRLEGKWVEPHLEDFEAVVTAMNLYSSEVGILMLSHIERIIQPVEGSRAWHLVNKSDKMGIALRRSSISAWEINQTDLAVFFPGFQKTIDSELERPAVIRERETIREVVKIRCGHCKQLYDETHDFCPNCGARK